MHLLSIVSLLALIAWPTCMPAGEKERGKEKTAGVARLLSPVGTVLVREKAGQAWKLPQLYDAVQGGNRLLTLPGARGVLETKAGDVRLTLVGNLPELSSAPLLETVALLHTGKKHDLDMTLDRGRIIIEARKEKGPAQVRVRFTQNEMELSLEPKARVVIERATIWRPGTPFMKKPGADHGPEAEGAFLVIDGKAEVTFQGETRSVQGPVRYYWDPRGGVQGPYRLRELPAWLTPGKDTSADITALHKAVEKLRRRLAESKEVSSFEPFLGDKDSLVRSLAVLSAGAADEIERVLSSLADAKRTENRHAAVVALRHWTALDAKHDNRLYDLLRDKKYSGSEAEIIMQLLHSFGSRDLNRPETYEALIDYLGSPKVAIRELGHWHLVRLVPGGKEIAFDAGGTAQQVTQAQRAWRKLIPPGELPKREKE